MMPRLRNVAALLLLAAPFARPLAVTPVTASRRERFRRKLRTAQSPLKVRHRLRTAQSPLKVRSRLRSMREERAEAPPVLSADEPVCLVPGEAISRVEVAPGNARRIWTGVDILASVDAVWDVLTDYEGLSNVVPNLVKNTVVATYDGPEPPRGARLQQKGASRLVPGISFSASTTLDVSEWPAGGLPAEMVASGDGAGEGGSDSAVREFDASLPLVRGVFPRPYSIGDLPFRDIAMQNVAGVGDFAHYQGVWRLQPLPGCAPDGQDAMRLTYAVEIKPSLPVPIALLESRIASDLAGNLLAIRDWVEKPQRKSGG